MQQTNWLSFIKKFVKKPDGDSRLCIDMTIMGSPHLIPVLHKSLEELLRATVFTKVDLKWGNHQIVLHPDSRNITAFQDSRGLYGHVILLYGVTSA